MGPGGPGGGRGGGGGGGGGRGGGGPGGWGGGPGGGPGGWGGGPGGPGGPGWGGPGGPGGPGWGPGGPGFYPGPGGFFGAFCNDICNVVSSCLSCLCCCWLFQAHAFTAINNLSWLPDPHFDRILIDGAWSQHTKQMGAAWVAVDSSGHVIVYKQYTFVALSALMIEVTACFQALKWCVQQHVTTISILTDCQVLIQKLRENGTEDWETMHMLSDIRALCNKFDYVCISKASRKAVKATHVAAKLASHRS
ncbi:hypothetical protein LOK49_LG12G01189 [Camellia lanceoleosa]|uniref:Uncharacterized protein n=1 Tax=Camellia lanceoleosa TaxID=1840588 RepID=A0ACC0FNP1_9ERIC|nr:hypothetical protein LOK49_LG12G01189 [Camellia lanceoleosa]